MIAKSLLYVKFLFAICFLVLNTSAQAQSLADQPESRWQLSLALGAGIRTNPVMNNDDIPLVAIPQVSYQGEHFFIQNLEMGYTLFQNEAQQLNLLLTPSYDQVFFKEWDINNFVDSSNFASTTKNDPTVEQVNRTIDKNRLQVRRMAAMTGLEYSQTAYDLDFQLQALKEATGYYDGSEVRIALSKNIILGKNDVKLTLGANWQSAATLNYFYGLTSQEVQGYSLYNAGSGVTGLFRFDWSYQLDEHWSLRFFTSYRHLSHSISDSPLVTSNNVITAFAGGVYHF